MMKRLFTLLMLCRALHVTAQHNLHGTVTDEKGLGLPGASLSFQPKDGKTIYTSTTPEGKFSVFLPAAWPVTLRVTFIGYRDTTMMLMTLPVEALTIVLAPSSATLKEVTVSTGYQELPKERATGSFVQVDRPLIERSVSTSVLDRLRDVVPGLNFAAGDRGVFRIRGQSTLFSNAEPLIVVDGFPYNQPIANLNPNDVESISVLKDAAAASIWGAKAGNGVVVITTKKGRAGKPVVSFSGTVQVGERPDLNYIPRMSTGDYIALEKQLFSEGYYTATENSTLKLPLSPVVEFLIAQRDGKQSAAAVAAQLSALEQQDAYRDISHYLYRRSVAQQYAASVSGGGADHRYYFSAGADRNLDNLAGNGYDRVTLNANQTWTTTGKELEFSAGLNYTESLTWRNNPGSLTWNRGSAIYPYADITGVVTRDYRQSFLTTAQQAGLLDWQYRPLDELAMANNKVTLSDTRLNTALCYHLPLGFTAEVRYQYDRAATSGRNLQALGSYYTRNLINRFTQVAGSTLTRPVPLGDILDLSGSTSVNHTGRGQLNYEHTFGERHELNGIAGYEVQTLHVLGNGHRYYGYDSEHATSKPVDGATLFSYYDNPASGTAIPLQQYENDATDHYLSYYSNLAYTYDRRLTVSGSMRLDRSNLFGVRTNQKGVPLWSAGAAWQLSREDFYDISWLPQLKLRATYGYNGNINRSLSAYTTATYFDGSNQGTLLPFALIINPPNGELRWERIRQLNLAVDLSALGDRISGTVEFYWKKGIDLIGNTAYAPSTGIINFTGNTAGSAGKGLDLSLSTRNLTGKLGWVSDLFFSRVTDQVTDYNVVAPASAYVRSGGTGAYPLTGRPLYAIYSYRSAGLDPATGDPQGYLNGAVSKDYAAIMAAAKPGDLVYSGPVTPTVFGALRNTFTYRGFSLSANISYRLGYYFKKNSIRYGSDHGLAQQSGDYALRWQQVGDEANTMVPSSPATPSVARDDFYNDSSDLVHKGDHIRLQDLRAAYQYKKAQLYLYGANLGILWRANKIGQDPDNPNFYPAPLTLAAGIRFTY